MQNQADQRTILEPHKNTPRKDEVWHSSRKRPYHADIVLEPTINDKNGLSVIWKEPFDSLVKAIVMSYGALTG